MIPACDRRTVGRSDGQTESTMAKTALCIASYADALSKMLLAEVFAQRKIHENVFAAGTLPARGVYDAPPAEYCHHATSVTSQSFHAYKRTPQYSCISHLGVLHH